MNEKYKFIDGKVIIIDENDNKTLGEYYDNLDEVLVQENLIEIEQETLNKLEQEKRKLKKYTKRPYIPIIFPITMFMALLGTPLLFNLTFNTNSFAIYVDTIFGNISLGLDIGILMSTVYLPLGVIFELMFNKIYKNNLKIEKGINSQLEYLKRQIEIDQKHLEDLKKDKKNTQTIKNFEKKIDDSKQQEMLKENLSYYYKLGYNDETKMTNQYLEENGPTLIKKK